MKYILCAMLLLLSVDLFAQQIIKGKIIDKNTRQPIEYASIIIAGNTGVTTGSSGYFKLYLQKDTATIFVSSIGYKTVQVTIRQRSPFIVVELVHGSVDLKELTINSYSNNNSFHVLSGLDLNNHPVNSSQDLMRLVPGLFIAQHMGGGKAEQIFIRGFDADHGSDINVSVDGMPVNMASHIHGQGYADLHFLIPETVSTFDYGKGPYYTNYGDFTTAGYLSFNTKDALDKSSISIEGGQFNSVRAMAMINLLDAVAKQKGENAYVAAEYNYTDGPFQFAEQYKRYNLFAKYTTQLNADNKLAVSASAFGTTWRASGEIPERAVSAGSTAVDSNGNAYKIMSANPLINRFGTIDSGQGGSTNRANFIARLSSNLKNNFALENEIYYTHYYFQLHVNSTFFAEDSINGDEKLQQETRDMFGYNGKLSKINYFGKNILTSAAGLSARMDRIYSAQYANVTRQYQFLSYINNGGVNENNINAYLDETLESGNWLINAGTRVDHLNFNYQNTTRNDLIVSPKINIQYTASSTIQFYLKSGKGFHSNDARAVIGNNGLQTLPAAYGTDLGINWKPIPHLFINAALWYLYLQQEFVYSDDGTIEPGDKTRRAGIDISARYQFNKWLFADVNINVANPRDVQAPAGQNYLPLAPTFTSTGGLEFKWKNGLNGGLSYRYMHKRPGNENYTLTADGYFITDLTVNYTRKKYTAGITVENLFNTKWNEFEAEEVTRLKNEPSAIDQMSFTPGTPFFAKFKLTVFF